MPFASQNIDERICRSGKTLTAGRRAGVNVVVWLLVHSCSLQRCVGLLMMKLLERRLATLATIIQLRIVIELSHRAEHNTSQPCPPKDTRMR